MATAVATPGPSVPPPGASTALASVKHHTDQLHRDPLELDLLGRTRARRRGHGGRPPLPARRAGAVPHLLASLVPGGVTEVLRASGGGSRAGARTQDHVPVVSVRPGARDVGGAAGAVLLDRLSDRLAQGHPVHEAVGTQWARSARSCAVEPTIGQHRILPLTCADRSPTARPPGAAGPSDTRVAARAVHRLGLARLHHRPRPAAGQRRGRPPVARDRRADRPAVSNSVPPRSTVDPGERAVGCVMRRTGPAPAASGGLSAEAGRAPQPSAVRRS